MHDCPNCRVPLHGHEEVCPACGARQVVRSGFSADRFTAKQPGFNFVPIIIAILVLAGCLFFAVQSSWIGQVINRSPQQVDPLATMTTADARNLVEQQITNNLATYGAKGKFTWTAQNKPVDKNIDQPVQVNIDTRLKNKDDRQAIIDPVKDYFAKAKITTLTMTDSRSHATWTYSVSTPMTTPSDQDQGESQEAPSAT